MRPSHSSIPRIYPARRILHPPNTRCSKPSIPRQFSHKSPRLLGVLHAAPRPQLPFLYPTSRGLNGQIFRFFTISSNHKKFIKETARLTVKFTFVFWLISTCFTIASLGILSERQERAFPSPPEWSLWTRFRFRRGKWWEIPENNEDEGFPNWARLYAEYEHALKRLEDPSKDGSDVVEQQEGGLLVPGVGKAGFDLTAKSEQWRQGYYEVLMGMARAAERMEGWVTDKKRNNAWAPEFIASPSNPRPKATPPGMPVPPEEDEQLTITDPPESFYLKVLTSKGFTSHQRLTAALSYADWLSFKKLPDSAEEMYRWALDIAISGLPTPDPSTIINPTTAILSSTAPKELITPNLIHAATTLATHYASTGNIASALPIYVSVLRARLHASPAPPSPPPPPKDSSLTGTLVGLFHAPPYPSLPSTGDEPLLRRPEDECEEAALKNYIGEILFATAGTSSQRRQGLNWVREGVSTAKSAQTLDSITADPERRKKCQLCEEVGLESWGKIMTYLAAEAREKRDQATAGGIKGLGSRLWGRGKLDEEVEELEGEEEGVVMRLAKLRQRMRKEEYEDMDRKYARTFVF
ncbi:uncharacterized protein BDR25DRAFT_300419 [Lindgomyces ingoldianus]|uniref:Uncharacterized protein n=1 Tax=Lindgomyces ingoldianus TaxID=673940 RepID=A0ACB6RB40_9PLEO|nr:uncharacterized protein BDR25DRAFT_300419 [Lindgomyces ingoldianus]KAF2476401.1 hypothetical protein BDR25DRAFT_300419 [Lindgomyces ingoldianus]